MDFSYNIDNIRSATICYSGTADAVAAPNSVAEIYHAIPVTVDRTLAYFEGINHADWYGNSGNHRDRMTTYITGLMKFYLDKNADYAKYIDGSQNLWLHDFEHRAASSEAKGCGP